MLNFKRRDLTAVCLRISVYSGRKSKYGLIWKSRKLSAFHLVELSTLKLFFKWRNRNLKFRKFGAKYAEMDSSCEITLTCCKKLVSSPQTRYGPQMFFVTRTWYGLNPLARRIWWNTCTVSYRGWSRWWSVKKTSFSLTIIVSKWTANFGKNFIRV